MNVFLSFFFFFFTLFPVPQREKADMVIVGKQSIDADSCQTGQMLAGLLNWPQCTFASSVEVAADKKVSNEGEERI
jgi:electron transfer flavoprotein alpha/beta subunit